MTSTWIVRRLAVTACLLGSWSLMSAQAVRSRILEEINPNNTVALAGSVSPRIAPQLQTGRMAPSTPIVGITLTFALTPQQKAELDALVKAQLTPGNPEYHQWLTPAEYADRFGMSQADIQTVEQWLRSEGFNIDRVANSRTSITFSGTVEQVETAFQTQMGTFLVDGKKHWANATNLSIPAALQGIVLSVRNLNDFRPHPMFHKASVQPSYTYSQGNYNFMTPADVATIYDVNSAYQSGYDGTGVTIAIMGQSAIAASDIEAFESAAGLPVKDPTMILVPGSGASAAYSGDESESDLDVEYSGAVAKGATIDFVYTGDSPNDDVFDSLQYAIDNRIGSVVSISYGACEEGLSNSDFLTLEQITEQGASQGQSIFASSGDSGSTSCYGYSNLTTAQQEALAVNYPASSDYVTGVGGTEFQSADANAGNGTGANSSQYWNSSNASNGGSAKMYIPETAWNDDVTCGADATKDGAPSEALCSGGGGVSALASKPSWQTGVSGIPSGSARAIPDVSLDSSNVIAPYLYCTSDQSSWSSGQKASCNSGFLDSSSQDPTAAGGTSFASPIFAGMMAIIDQKTNSSQGIAAAELYKLASNAGTYSSAFHDITQGGNQCTAGSSYCSGSAVNDYAAGTGYDEATGLGSVDFNNLMTAWPNGTSSHLTTTTALPASSTVAANSSDLLTITVAPASGTGTPTGSVTLYDGTTEQTEFQLTTVGLTNGAATFSYAPTATTYNGAHVLEVVYSGDATFSGSTATVSITVSGGTNPPTFTLAAPSVTVTDGQSGTSTVTLTSQNSYAGTVSFDSSIGAGLYITSNNASGLANGCYSITNSSGSSIDSLAVSANSTATATLTFYTSSSQCTSAGSGSMRPGYYRIKTGNPGGQAQNRAPFRGAIPIGASALAGVLLFGFRRSRSKVWTMLGCLILLMALSGLAVGCGGSSGSGGGGGGGGGGTGSEVTKGTYSLELVGIDSTNGAINASTSLTLTVN